MSEFTIKSVERFTEIDENNIEIQMSRMIIIENGIEKEIILKGDGELKVASPAL